MIGSVIALYPGRSSRWCSGGMAAIFVGLVADGPLTEDEWQVRNWATPKANLPCVSCCVD